MAIIDGYMPCQTQQLALGSHCNFIPKETPLIGKLGVLTFIKEFGGHSIKFFLTDIPKGHKLLKLQQDIYHEPLSLASIYEKKSTGLLGKLPDIREKRIPLVRWFAFLKQIVLRERDFMILIEKPLGKSWNQNRDYQLSFVMLSLQHGPLRNLVGRYADLYEWSTTKEYGSNH